MKLEARPKFENPFRPGAGHMPLYLAGRKEESMEFKKLLNQKIILQNLVLTGLRGVTDFQPSRVRPRPSAVKDSR